MLATRGLIANTRDVNRIDAGRRGETVQRAFLMGSRDGGREREGESGVHLLRFAIKASGVEAGTGVKPAGRCQDVTLECESRAQFVPGDARRPGSIRSP